MNDNIDPAMQSDLPLVLVLGAGRSGTNLLADVLHEEPSLHNTVENRYIWNYGQKTLAHDVRDAAEVTPKIAAFIRKYFEDAATRTGKTPIDKTPSNVFRVAFARAIFPHAKFIHIIRDGRANVYSRLREWHGGNAVVESQEKSGAVEVKKDYRTAFVQRRIERVQEMMSSKSLPPSRLPTFLADNVGAFANQLVTGGVVRYGERFPGMSEHLRAYDTIATSAAQWREGVMHALTEGRRIGPDAYLEVRYEQLVNDPNAAFDSLAPFLGIPSDSPARDNLVGTVEARSSHDWHSADYADFIRTVEPHLRPTCEFLGYDWQ